MDEIQSAQLNKLNQLVVDGENLNEEQKELRRELSALQRALAVAAVAAPQGDPSFDNAHCASHKLVIYTVYFSTSALILFLHFDIIILYIVSFCIFFMI